MAELVLVDDATALAARGVELMRAAIAGAVTERGGAAVALSGGATPGPAYRLLAAHTSDLSRCRWFFVDERAVPPDSERSNFRSAKRDLFDPGAVAASCVFRMQGELEPELAARLYTDVLRRELGERPRFDLLVAGLGDDGHTASLFPETGAVLLTDALATAVEPGRGLEPRVTLTRPVLLDARRIVILVQGAAKRAALWKALEPGSEDEVPARLYRAAPPGVVTWLVDRAAAP